MTAVRVCDYCGLPLSGDTDRQDISSLLDARTADDAALSVAAPGVDAVYCCFGCRFAAGVTRERGEQGAVRWTLLRLGFAIFCTLNVLSFTMALWTTAVYDDTGPTPLAITLAGLFRYLGLLFSLPVLFLLGQPLVENAWQSLRRGSLSTDLLLALGVAASFAYSAVSVVRGEGEVYFEVGCVILVMVTLGRWLEATGRLQASAALDELQKLLPNRVRIWRNGKEDSLPLDQLAAGDCVRVLPGEHFPADGKLRTNSTSVDQQILTGESWPVVKTPGDEVLGGTLNLDGDVLIEVTQPPSCGTLARLIDVVRTARASRGSYQRLADRVAAGFFPTIALVASGAFLFHYSNGGLARGILAGLSVVLISCPCALGVATPLAVWSALGQAARRQVLFRSGEALERLAEVRAVCFDKTGTLTTGVARVVSFVATCTDREETLVRSHALAGGSMHPMATAVADFTRDASNFLFPPQTRLRAGRGIVASIDGSETALGNQALMEDCHFTTDGIIAECVACAARAGQALSLIGWDGRVRGVFVLEEELRPEAQQAIEWCRSHRLEVLVLTGDHRQRGARFSAELGVPVRSELLPEEKLAAIRELQQTIGPVAMVGDGINDAPALAAAHVGVALGCGTDVSRDSAGVCLMSNDLNRFCWAIEFSHRTVRTIRRDLIWAFVYNAVGVAAAACGWLNPAAAALLMVVSSFLVIRNSLRLSPPSLDEATHHTLNSRAVAGSADVCTALDRAQLPTVKPELVERSVR